MKKILASLLLLIGLVSPAGTQNWSAPAVTATATASGPFSGMPIDTFNYPWAQSITWTFVAVGTTSTSNMDAGNDASFTSFLNPVKHFSAGIGGHSDSTAAFANVLGESWCVPTSAGRYFRLRNIAYAGGTDTAIVTLSSNNCQGAVQQGQGATFGAGWPVYVNPLPLSSTFTSMANTGTTGAVTTALAAATGKTTYVCGFDVTAIGGTATVGPITLGLIAGQTGGFTYTYQMASLASGNMISEKFSPCLPAAAANQQIFMTTTADGTATAVTVNTYGFLQ